MRAAAPYLGWARDIVEIAIASPHDNSFRLFARRVRWQFPGLGWAINAMLAGLRVVGAIKRWSLSPKRSAGA
jgi:hypothetical protein